MPRAPAAAPPPPASPLPRFEYQIDIMDMSYLKQSNQPRYALVVIDIFSKYGDVQPMNNKGNNSVYEALRLPLRLYTRSP